MHCENCKNSIERSVNIIDGASCQVNLKKKQKGIQNEISKKKRSAQQLNAQIDRLIEIEIEKARKRAEEEARRKAAAEAAVR